MSRPPRLPDDWVEYLSNPAGARYAKKLLNNAASWEPRLMRYMRYISEFMGLHCAPDLLAMRVFPNAKEITESLAAYRAALNYCQFKVGDPDVVMLAVGDGRSPRTAATFAFRSRWQCYSVDPNLGGGKKRWEAIDRLQIIPTRVEQFSITAKKAVVVAVHSHAKLGASIAAVKADSISVVAMPCCIPLTLPCDPDREYRDSGIMSPHNLIRIWNLQRDSAREQLPLEPASTETRS